MDFLVLSEQGAAFPVAQALAEKSPEHAVGYYERDKVSMDKADPLNILYFTHWLDAAREASLVICDSPGLLARARIAVLSGTPILYLEDTARRARVVAEAKIASPDVVAQLDSILMQSEEAPARPWWAFWRRGA